MLHPLCVEAKGHVFHRAIRRWLELDQQALLRNRVKISAAVPAHTPKPLAADARRRIGTEPLSNLIDAQRGLGALLAIHALAKCDGPILPAFVTTWHLLRLHG